MFTRRLQYELVLDEQIIEEESSIEAFTTHISIKKEIYDSKIINNQNNRTLILTIIITFFSYIMVIIKLKNL